MTLPRLLLVALALALAPGALHAAAPDGPPPSDGPEMMETATDGAASLLQPRAPLVLAAPLPTTSNPGWSGELEGVVPVPFQDRGARRGGLALVATGATLLVGGSFIDGSAGSVVMVSGVLIAALGVYRML